MFKDKVLMITGGTGSFGSAVLKRFIDSDIKEIRIFSRDEKKQDDLRHQIQSNKVQFYIGDVRDQRSVVAAIKRRSGPRTAVICAALVSIVLPILFKELVEAAAPGAAVAAAAVAATAGAGPAAPPAGTAGAAGITLRIAPFILAARYSTQLGFDSVVGFLLMKRNPSSAFIIPITCKEIIKTL
jgi:NAD(P)-dependent dehydrogenase (short-subunit alcohol dehydrogenase family)